jgi:hypothetical protein
MIGNMLGAAGLKSGCAPVASGQGAKQANNNKL